MKLLKRVLVLAAVASLAGAQSVETELTLGPDEQVLVAFAEGFSFPFYGEVYTSAWVGADGFLAFGNPDLSGVSPSEAALLGGPARVAAFYAALDPAAGGAITVRLLARSVRVRWEDLPRRDGSGSSTFSVTLFDSGDIWIVYERIAAAAAEQLQGIVGVTPPGPRGPNRVDLSDSGGVGLIQQEPLYEVFEGADFDLLDSGVFFQASRTRLVFPVYDEEGETFTGLAFTNFGQLPAGLGLEVRRDDSQLLPAPANPTLFVLDPATQLARLGHELIGSSPAADQRGWAAVDSSSDQIAAFFLKGELGPAGIEKVDGAPAQQAGEAPYCLTRVYQGRQVFPSFEGPRDALTTLFVVNPDEAEADVSLTLFNPLGQQLARTTRKVAGRGRLEADIKTLFAEDSLDDGYVCVDHLAGATAALEVVRLPEAIMVLAAQPAAGAARAFSAQLAHARDVFTSLKLVNPSDQPQAVTLTAFLQDAEGVVSTRVTPLVLQPGQSFQSPVDLVFSLGPGATQTIVGSIEMEAVPGGVIGDVIFGDPQRAAFGAALPLQQTPFLEAVFSHLANGPTNVEFPSFDPFTGLAIFNPGEETATIEIAVFAPDGTPAGSTEIQLGPRQRISELVEQLIPETAEMSAGFVRLTASRPVVAQQIFGNSSLQFFAAIPARVVQ